MKIDTDDIVAVRNLNNPNCKFLIIHHTKGRYKGLGHEIIIFHNKDGDVKPNPRTSPPDNSSSKKDCSHPNIERGNMNII